MSAFNGMERDRYFYSSVGNNKTDFSGMYDNEYSCLYKETINDEELVHPLRILNKHMGYIGNYLDYIEQFVSEEKFEQKTDKRKLLSQIRGQLYLYVEKLQYLQENNPDYFKLHN